MKMILLGTGTSHGIPVIGCSCNVCSSSDEKDKRNRCCAYVTNRDEPLSEAEKVSFMPTDILIDAGQEFRIQALKNRITRLDAVLLTHAHADHIFGLDDLRIFSFTKPELNSAEKRKPLPIYANSWTIHYIREAFAYAFGKVTQGGGVPNITLEYNRQFSLENPLKVNELEIIRVPLMHGSTKDSGYILMNRVTKKAAAYLTDCSFVPEESFALLQKITAGYQLEHLVIDALRKREHTTHFNFDQALAASDRIGAKHTWFTHMCHDFTHNEIIEYINEHLGQYKNLSGIVTAGGSVAPGFDGMEICF